MTSTELLPAAVLTRKAVVYIRQSTQAQVQSNLESACSGDCDQPFRLKVITDSGDRDHAMTRPITFDRNAHICLCR